MSSSLSVLEYSSSDKAEQRVNRRRCERGSLPRLRLPAPPKGIHQLSDIPFRNRLVHAQGGGFVVGAFVRAEEPIHQRREVGVVSRVALALVMPVVQLRRADQQTQRRRNRQADVAV